MQGMKKPEMTEFDYLQPRMKSFLFLQNSSIQMNVVSNRSPDYTLDRILINLERLEKELEI